MAREEQQPMSDARLAEIQRTLARVDDSYGSRLVRVNDLYGNNLARELLAEVESLRPALESALQLASRQDDELQRLRAREAALMEIVQAVAFDDPIQPDSGNFVCYYCCACAPYESAVVHGGHCAYEQARALLASGDEAK